jgi:hypothetical protein
VASRANTRPMAHVEVLNATHFALHAAKDIGRADAIYDVAINRGANIVVTFHMWPSEAHMRGGRGTATEYQRLDKWREWFCRTFAVRALNWEMPRAFLHRR